MSTIIIGHGGIDASQEPRLVPPGYEITMYSDFGAVLEIPATTNGAGELEVDYTNVASAWEHYKAEGYVGEYDVTYNMALGPIEPDELVHARSLDWGATVIAVGDPLPNPTWLCTAT